MATDWAVTTATERIKLDSHRKNSTQFTVTNPGQAADRAVFDVLPGEGTAEDWFSVEQPQRLVKGGDSVSYIVETTVPEGVADGTYAYQALVYSANVPPEENSRLSGRITFDLVNPKPKKKPPWLLIGIVAAAVVVLAVVAWLVFSGGSATVPDVGHKSQADAVKAITDAGLKAGLRHKQDPAHDNLVVGQDPPAGTELDDGGTVTIDVAVNLTAPVLSSPADKNAFPEVKWPPLKWRPVADVDHYKVFISTSRCAGFSCTVTPAQQFDARGTTFTPKLSPPTAGSDTTVIWTVQAVDDFGTLGPTSQQSSFRLGAVILK